MVPGDTSRWNVAGALLRDGSDAAPSLRVRGAERRLDLTRGELRDLVRRAAGALARLGVGEEERVLVVLPDGPEFLAAALGAMWNGSVPVLVNAFLRPGEYAPFLEETRARAVVTTPETAATLGAPTGGARSRPALLTVDAAGGGSFADALAAASPAAEAFPTHADDPALWLYSSGTTGRPKGVVHLHRNVRHAIASYGRHVLGTAPDDVAYATSKLFFAYGLGASLYFPLAAGATVVLSPEPFAPARTWRILAEEQPTLFFAVPAVYRALLDSAPAEAARSLARVRRFVSAGEALPEAIFHAWKERFGAEILDGIGSTEALHIFLSNRPGECVPGTLGRPVPGYDVEVVDEHGARVPAGTPGALRVRGDSLAAGYWQRTEATRRAFVGPWFVTGDQAVENPDGTFSVLGRTDDLLKVSGQWVSPVEVEGVIATVGGVRECAVVGGRDASGLTELVACVAADGVPEPEVRARIEAACAEALPRYKRPRRFLFLDALPRTVTGKVQRFLLRERAAHT